MSCMGLGRGRGILYHILCKKKKLIKKKDDMSLESRV